MMRGIKPKLNLAWAEFLGKMKNSELSCCMQDARLFQAENKPKVQK